VQGETGNRMRPATLRDLALETAEAHRGLWYSWGGDDPAQGFDCSGLIVEIMKTCGLIARQADMTASGIYQMLAKNGKSLQSASGPGCLAFWGATAKPDMIYHVEMIWVGLDGKWFSIGASGGTSKTVTREDAMRDNAFIKVRPVDGRGGYVFFADPFIGG